MPIANDLIGVGTANIKLRAVGSRKMIVPEVLAQNHFAWNVSFYVRAHFKIPRVQILAEFTNSVNVRTDSKNNRAPLFVERSPVVRTEPISTTLWFLEAP
jgi:hypothetical protein